MMQRFLSTLVACCAAAFVLTADAALGCPMCKQAAKEDPQLAEAFATSILFMMSMPFMLVTGFGIAFWRLSKRGGDEEIEET